MNIERKKCQKNVFIVRKRNLSLNLVRSSENTIFTSVYNKYANNMQCFIDFFSLFFPIEIKLIEKYN